jgi:hypothetical protein
VGVRGSTSGFGFPVQKMVYCVTSRGVLADSGYFRYEEHWKVPVQTFSTTPHESARRFAPRLVVHTFMNRRTIPSEIFGSALWASVSTVEELRKARVERSPVKPTSNSLQQSTISARRFAPRFGYQQSPVCRFR